LENENADESTYLYPSPDLRNYAKILRKIEREPAEAPQTSAAVRALERVRRNRGKALLENSRTELEKINKAKQEALNEQTSKAHQISEQSAGNDVRQSITKDSSEENEHQNGRSLFDDPNDVDRKVKVKKNTRSQRRTKKDSSDDLFSNRKPITEVLHDIYDKNIQ
jgi:hypothetical protein